LREIALQARTKKGKFFVIQEGHLWRFWMLDGVEDFFLIVQFYRKSQFAICDFGVLDGIGKCWMVDC